MANAHISIKVEYPSSPEAFPNDINMSDIIDSQYAQGSAGRKLHNLGQRSPEAAVTAEKGAFCQLESQKQNIFEQCTSSMPESHVADAPHGHGRSQNNQRLCLVCGDVASGYHYGVASCEACKAFFKRTVQGNIQYICPAVNECDITKRRRKSCQACRYRKCLHMGMLKEGVRLDRVRGGRQKYHTKRKLDDSSDIKVPVKQESKAPENSLIHHLLTIEPNKVIVSNEEVERIEDEEVKVWALLGNLANIELVNMIGWAKQIPDFLSLTLNDQMTLLQSAWNEILVFGLSYRSLPHDNKLVFSDDFVMERNESKAVRLDLLNDLTLKLTEKLKGIHVDKEEYVLMKALILCNADIVNLEDSEAVERLQDKFFDAFHDHVNNNHPCDKRRVSHLLMTLPLLRQISSASMQHLSKLMKHKEIPLQQLLREMVIAKMEKETVPFSDHR